VQQVRFKTKKQNMKLRNNILLVILSENDHYVNNTHKKLSLH